MSIKYASLVVFCFAIQQICYAQDTIRVTPKIEYSSADWPVRGKGFVGQLEYGIEEIYFNKLQKRIEACYYFDAERICSGSTYTLLNDSTLIIEDTIESEVFREVWNYEHLEDKVKVWRDYDGIIESGYVSSLIPLIKEGQFSIKSQEGNKMLWLTEYKYNKTKNAQQVERYIYTRQKVHGKIYSIEQLDKPPTFRDGTSLPLEIPYEPYACISAPFYSLSTISFIIDKYGEILNIRQLDGTYDMQHCPFTIMEIMKTINGFGKLNPGMRKNKPVNTKYIMKVKIE